MADPTAIHARTRLSGGVRAGALAEVGRNGASGHEITRGKRLRIAGEFANSNMCLHMCFGRWPRHGAEGGGRPAAGEWQRSSGSGRNKKRGGGCFLTARGDLVGRESDREVDGSGDRRRRPSFNSGGSELKWAHGKWRGRRGSSGVSEGGCGKALGALI
jgi:hypothetical protein